MINNRKFVVTVLTLFMLIPMVVIGEELDAFLMQDIEDAHERLVSYLAGQDRYSAVENIDEMEDMYSDLELYFSLQEGGEKGKGIAQDSVVLLGKIRLSVEGGMYQSALEASEELSRQCMQCHSLYK